MGVDYESVSGIGIEFTESMVQVAISFGMFSAKEWLEDKDTCLGSIGELYGLSGNCYTGEDLTCYLFVRGSTLGEVNRNAPGFIDRVSQFAPNLSVNELKVISDTMIC
jgi:hypothetical protein